MKTSDNVQNLFSIYFYKFSKITYMIWKQLFSIDKNLWKQLIIYMKTI
jgi:hypothetical protein